eukprot:gnl/TRDRNA2_/TRDRNA2_87395_c0_seq1.p1 gnl/TRDRNA2_/TRDRNA2_87395_c0~~gnl/TRDRNA2_/TRDRNA2_87395_c0_seq1.p1  ORF type:complete len:274 (+),score=19.92 gnl/TRDRNA2_/TRDRNA2_87395_c0_seq1:363-1184(+)
MRSWCLRCGPRAALHPLSASWRAPAAAEGSGRWPLRGLPQQQISRSEHSMSDLLISWSLPPIESRQGPCCLLNSTGEMWRMQDNDVPRRPTDYELSLGHIIDTLRNDYPAFFERSPDWDIYGDSIELELGHPLEAVPRLHGKKSYQYALSALRRMGSRVVRDGNVVCRIKDRTTSIDGSALRVHWHCSGHISLLGTLTPLYISAISAYKLAPRDTGAVQPVQLEQIQGPTGSRPLLSHVIHKHTIEFIEIQPPTLRDTLAALLPSQAREAQLA